MGNGAWIRFFREKQTLRRFDERGFIDRRAGKTFRELSLRGNHVFTANDGAANFNAAAPRLSVLRAISAAGPPISPVIIFPPVALVTPVASSAMQIFSVNNVHARIIRDRVFHPPQRDPLHRHLDNCCPAFSLSAGREQ